jgi:hypothetical protein
VRTYQASPFATFGTEASQSGDSTARGRGEAAALEALRGWEKDGTLTTKADNELAVRLLALVEVPQLGRNRERVDLAKLQTRWADELITAFPPLALRKDFIATVFAHASRQSDWARQLDASMAQGRTLRSSKRPASRDEPEVTMGASPEEIARRRKVKGKRTQH